MNNSQENSTLSTSNLQNSSAQVSVSTTVDGRTIAVVETDTDMGIMQSVKSRSTSTNSQEQTDSGSSLVSRIVKPVNVDIAPGA